MAIKSDFKGIFICLSKLIDTLVKSKVDNDLLFVTKILEKIMEGTDHNDLFKFQMDTSIDVIVKTQRYTKAITLMELHWAGEIPNITNGESKNPQVQTEEDNNYYKFKIKKLNVALATKQLELEKAYQDLESKRVDEIRVLLPDKEVELKGEYFHKQLPEIIDLISSRNAFGWPEQLYIWGAAGAGKTHMTYQIGRALSFTEDRIFTYPMGPTVTESKLLGFNNFASGSYVKGWLYEAFKNGGLVALDEGDLADAQVFASANSMDNSYYVFGNGELVKRHKDFYLIVWANTIGTGSTRGFQRNVLDAATRDRFTFYELLYDEEMEREIYGYEAWAKLVQVIREHVTSTMEGSFYVTPRATRKGYAYRKFPVEKLLDWLVFKGCSRNVKDPILASDKIRQAITEFKRTVGEDKKEMGDAITGGKKKFKMTVKAASMSPSYKDLGKLKNVQEFQELLEKNEIVIDPDSLSDEEKPVNDGQGNIVGKQGATPIKLDNL